MLQVRVCDSFLVAGCRVWQSILWELSNPIAICLVLEEENIVFKLASSAGRVVKSQISDKFIENFEAMKDYSPGKCVVARVIAVIQGKQADSTPRLELSLRPSVVKKDGWKSVSYEDIKVGDKLYGNVKKVESYGVFITIEHSRVRIVFEQCSS